MRRAQSLGRDVSGTCRMARSGCLPTPCIPQGEERGGLTRWFLFCYFSSGLLPFLFLTDRHRAWSDAAANYSVAKSRPRRLASIVIDLRRFGGQLATSFLAGDWLRPFRRITLSTDARPSCCPARGEGQRPTPTRMGRRTVWMAFCHGILGWGFCRPKLDWVLSILV